ncbi:MAG: adenylate/guanylate cyclase domain-containing protein [Candidatus Micrarchaeia archaeon]
MNKKRDIKKISYFTVGLTITFLLCISYILQPKPLHIFDLKLYDLLFLLRGEEKQSDRLVIVAIDEPSLEKLGRWPWDRDLFAKMIKKISEFSPAVIAFDVLFSEQEKNDIILSKSISDAGIVLMPIVFFFDKEDLAPKDIILKSCIRILNPEKFERHPPVSSRNVLVPVEKISLASAGFGHINMFPDVDGTIRSEVLFIEYEGCLIPSLSLKAVAVYLGIPEEKLIIDATRGIFIGKRYLKTDKQGRILIPYYGGNETFKYISAVDILNGRVNKRDLEEKIVLIGATAVGIYDLRVTPFSSALPGVEKHANVIEALISGKNIVSAHNGVIFLSLILTGVLSILIYQKLRAMHSLILLITLISIIFIISYFLFVSQGIWFSYLYPSANLFFQFICITAIKYAFFEKEARQIKRIFSSYVTERIVSELIKNPSMAKLGGDKREITVLFSDIRDFTSLSEKLTPEQVVEILNDYFSSMTEIILKWEGTLDKFIGDAIMVFWGAPIEQPDHAERAVNCAIEMLQKLREICEKLKAEGKPILKIGIGINTGEAIVGNIGAEGKKMDYTVIGDSVNIASRLEGLNKQFNTEIIISEFTYKKILPKIEMKLFENLVSFEALGKISIRGKREPIEIYKVSVVS